jgi:hypothetical protein
VPIPERFRVERNANELTVRWRWFKGAHIAMLFFVIAWDAFLLFWYFGFPSEQGGLIFKIFPIAHVAVGVGMTYFVLTGFLNTTTLSARSGVLRVHHGPLPWRGNRSIRVDDLKQLYVAEVQRRSTDSDSRRTTITYAYDLCAMLESGQEVRLVRGLDSTAQGRYLESVFEAQLGIEDRPVAGEVPKQP